MLRMQTILKGLVGVAVIWTVMSFLALEVAEAAEEKAPAKVITAKVVQACPEGRFIKVKTEEDKVLGFLRVVGADQKTVKALKPGEQVKLTIVVCPKTKKDTVTKVAKVTTETK